MNKVWTLDYMVRMCFVLCSFAAMFAAVWWFKKKQKEKPFKEDIRLLSSLYVGQKQKLVLVQCDDVKILVAFTENSSNVLFKKKCIENSQMKKSFFDKEEETNFSSDVSGILELQKRKSMDASSYGFKSKRF
jgi:flagellar biogenesis protein FliO